MARRGTYAKGVAKREEILDAALNVVATNGYRNASVRDIADAVDLSPAGLLHYFGTKEELFVAILEARDARDTADFADDNFIDEFVALIRRNAAVPGLVHLYAQLAVDAGDPQHPAHNFFRERTTQLETQGHNAVVAAQTAGEIRADLDPQWIIRTLHALADGLQTAWLLDPTIDMAADIEQFLRAIQAR